MIQQAIYIVKVLQDAGFQAVFAGGCVRDTILDYEIKDYDIATNATPDQIQELFKAYKTLAIGKAFGVINVIIDGYTFDVATFRSDGNYSDGRHPDSIEFTSMENDAKRRDLTINGIFFDPIKNETIDYVNGLTDLKAKKIRLIGNATDRINEDSLRMLRIIRFAIRFDFDIDPDTLKAVKQHATQIAHISGERISSEFLQILRHKRAIAGLNLLYDTGLMRHILPELVALKGCEQPVEHHPEGDVWSHSLLALEAVKREENVTDAELWSALLHDIGKPATKVGLTFYQHHKIGADIARIILTRLRVSNELKELVASIIYNHMTFVNVPQMRLSSLKRLFQLESFNSHVLVHKADCIASQKPLDTVHMVLEKYNAYTPAEIKPVPFVTGKNLIALGLKPSPLFKTILTEAMNQQLEGFIQNEDEGISFIKEKFLCDL